MKKPSRQYLWQLKKKAEGKCCSCGRPSSSRTLCDRCAKRGGTKKRHPSKEDWSNVDWSCKNKDIAQALGVNYSSVAHHRNIKHTTTLSVPNGMTVAQLKAIVNRWPLTDEHGEPAEVFLQSGYYLSGPCIEAMPVSGQNLLLQWGKE